MPAGHPGSRAHRRHAVRRHRARPSPTAWSRPGRPTPTAGSTTPTTRAAPPRSGRSAGSPASPAPAPSTAARSRSSPSSPGRLPFGDGRRQAPHLDVSVFARGMLRPHRDPDLLPRRGRRPTRPTRCCPAVDPERRHTLVAVRRGRTAPRSASTSTSRASMRPSSSPSERRVSPTAGCSATCPATPRSTRSSATAPWSPALLRAEAALATAQARWAWRPAAAARVIGRVAGSRPPTTPTSSAPRRPRRATRWCRWRPGSPATSRRRTRPRPAGCTAAPPARTSSTPP